MAEKMYNFYNFFLMFDNKTVIKKAKLVFYKFLKISHETSLYCFNVCSINYLHYFPVFYNNINNTKINLFLIKIFLKNNLLNLVSI